jgi:hypothetical protein
MIQDYKTIERNFCTVEQLLNVKHKAECLPKDQKRYWGFKLLNYTGPDTSFTTFVNILPLTNRTFDRKTLVATGNEASAGTQKKEDTATTRQSKQPRAKCISRRANKGAEKFVASYDSSSSVSEPPPVSSNIMTAEQVLACNDEQMFYTSSLRGYGNILDCMGIQIEKKNHA